MKLESLYMRYIDLEEGSRPENVVFDRLRQLKLCSDSWQDDSCVLDLMLQSPMLESLYLWNWGRVTNKLEQPLMGDWPHLKKVYVGCKVDAQLAFIFKELGMISGTFLDRSPIVQHRTHNHLESLDPISIVL